MHKPPYQPRIFQSIQMLFLYQFIFWLIPLGILSGVTAGNMFWNLPVQIAASLVAFILLIFWLTRKYSLNLKSHFSPERLKFKYLFPVIFLSIGADILISEIGNIMKVFLPMDEQMGDTLRNIYNPDTGLTNAVILFIVLAPALEEILFRGLILKGYLKHYSIPAAVFVSAVLFGLFHLNVWQFPGALVWGLIAGWLFVKTDSLLLCIFGHMVMNGDGLIAVFLRDYCRIVIPGFTSGYGENTFQPPWFTMMGLILLVGNLTLLRKILH